MADTARLQCMYEEAGYLQYVCHIKQYVVLLTTHVSILQNLADRH